MKRAVIWLAAPPSPKCFDSRDAWTNYLESAQESRKGDRRPFIDGKYRAAFSFCADCSAQHALRMTQQGRCQYQQYVANLIAGENAHATT